MMIIDILSEDTTSDFSSCQEMVEAIHSIHKAKGDCKKEDLLPLFPPEEVSRLWDMADFFAQLNLQEDFEWKTLLSA